MFKLDLASKSHVPFGTKQIGVIPCGPNTKSPVPVGISGKTFRPKGTRLFENGLTYTQSIFKDTLGVAGKRTFCLKHKCFDVFFRDTLARGPLGKGDKRGIG